ncbi:MFS general substrate transporter [Gymnopilus junonius]|uniref:MFS general substrate transporter n=1 Tax=Gymnopilus junonius TaxID=109634 RepID=A0A9P5NGY3_GYMJU|nr:MFS general substrate transporter [Gymnopilus junonius]
MAQSDNSISMSGTVADDIERGSMTKRSTLEEKKEVDNVNVVDVVDIKKEPDGLDETFPEGGFQAWAAVAGGFLAQFTCFGYINSFGVYQDFYVRRYLTNFTPSDIGWIGGIQIFLNFSLGAFSGMIFDRGYSKHLMYSSTLLYAISLFCLSLAHQNSYYQIFLTNGVGLGIASGLTYPGSFAITGHYFVKKRPLAVGLVSSGAALGAVIHPIMLNRLINGPVGFHNGVRISAAMNTVLLLVACWLTRTRLAPKSQQNFLIMKWAREPQYLSLLIGSVFVFLGLFFSPFYLQLDAILHGVPPNFAFYGLSILNAASFFGRTVTGYYGRKLGVFNLGASFTTAAGIVVICLLAVKDITGVVLFSIFFGLFSGGSVSLTNAMIAHISTHPSEVGTRLGIYFGIGGVLGLFASPISGALLTSRYLWTRSILFAGIMLTTAGVCFFISRYFVVKMKGTQRV